VRIRDKYFSNFSAALAGLICFLGLGFAVAPAASPQDAGQAAPAAAPAAAAPVVLPDGDGKPIATEYCQTCHKLTNLTKAHKDLDDWKDTIHTMIDRGARIPDEKIDTLAQYLTANFGPKDASAPAAGAAAAAPARSRSRPPSRRRRTDRARTCRQAGPRRQGPLARGASAQLTGCAGPECVQIAVRSVNALTPGWVIKAVGPPFRVDAGARGCTARTWAPAGTCGAFGYRADR